MTRSKDRWSIKATGIQNIWLRRVFILVTLPFVLALMLLLMTIDLAVALVKSFNHLFRSVAAVWIKP